MNTSNKQCRAYIYGAFSMVTATLLSSTAFADGEVTRAKPANKDYKIDLTGASFGAFDSNIFDKGTAPTMAAGGDVNLGINVGVPLSSGVSWVSMAGLGSSARQGLSTSAGDANALRVDGQLKTGIELTLFGLPPSGKMSKKVVTPALKLTLEGKYAYWSNPFVKQPTAAGQSDASFDALEPADPDSTAEASADENADADSGEAEAAVVPVGGQTFTNPNTHHKVTGTVRLMLEMSSQLAFTLEGGGGRDMVRLDDTVQASPEYNELSGDFSAKIKAFPKYLWLTVGYSYNHRSFDEPNQKGLSQDVDVNGGRAAFDIPLTAVKLKLGYDVLFKSAAAGAIANNRRHQVQLGADVPLSKRFSVVADARYTATEQDASPTSTRFIGLAGVKAKW